MTAELLFALISGCASELSTDNNNAQENHKKIIINFNSVTHDYHNYAFFE